MSDTTNAPQKLRLKGTDTNHFKVSGEGDAQAVAGAGVNANQNASATQQIVDPISLRDTATGRLKKVAENQEGVAAAPTTMASAMKTQTVRLKVVRQEPKPAAPQATIQAAPGATQVVMPPTATAAAPAQNLTGTVTMKKVQPAENTTPGLKINAPAATAAAPAAAPAQNLTGTVTMKKVATSDETNPGLKINKPVAPAAASPSATVKLKPLTPTGAGLSVKHDEPAAPEVPKMAPTAAKVEAPQPTPAPAEEAAPAPVAEKKVIEEPVKFVEAPQEGTSTLVAVGTIVALVALVASITFSVLTYINILK